MQSLILFLKCYTIQTQREHCGIEVASGGRWIKDLKCAEAGADCGHHLTQSAVLTSGFCVPLRLRRGHRHLT